MPGAPTYTTRFKVVAVLLLIGATAAFTGAFLSFQSGQDDPILTSGEAGDYVDELIPRRDTRVPQQSTVGIDLIPSWTGTLVVNGTEIPADQLSVTDELGLVQFTPRDGAAVEELQAGANNISAVVWPRAESRQTAAETVTWSFEVV